MLEIHFWLVVIWGEILEQNLKKKPMKFEYLEK